METRLIQRRLSVAATLLILLATACRDVPTASQFGNVRISVRKSGGIPNGSFALVVGAERRRIGTGEIAIINGISPGTYDVSLQVPENCEVMGTHVVTLMVVPGETVDLAFVTVCVSTGIEITTRTKGYDDGLGFELAVNGQSWLKIAATSL